VLLGRPAAGLLAAWIDDGSGTKRIERRRFDDALVAAAPEQALPMTPGEPSQLSIAGDTNGWALAWTESMLGSGALVRLRRFDASDASLDAVPVLVSEQDAGGAAFDGSEPSLAAAGDDYVVAWTTRRSDPDGQVRARRFAPAAMPAVVVTAAANRPAVVASGSGWAVLVHDDSDVGLYLLDQPVGAASAVSAPSLAGNGRQRGASLTGVAGRLWVVWSDDGVFSTFAEVALAFLFPEAT
jgi:hypothetical protein